MTIERIAYRPLRRAPSLAVLITAIGVSYLLQNLALLVFKAEAKSFSSVIPLKALSLAGGRLTISGETLVTIPLCVLIMIVLTVFIKKSKTGRGMIAVSEDKDAAILMGVNVNKTIAITFAIGSALAAIASALMFSTYTNLSTTSGAMPGIRAFVAAVFGGIGSVPGAMIGGILLGVIEVLSRAYISTQLGDAIVFLILILVLLVRPTGILGKKIQEKV
jgi:branched-chain amino acid transport system permease protein